ncbi:type I glyceraldehyde-3-phosphate dehydrogenase [Helicobacter bilis]|uniref:type I glyceraldehyde-3-phosphate dehydrogenase n=1 Tax=Helicobacter bilis TaxID=37372 RepID=UPI00051D071C|nr:type I glyceraldehyde-3-phosphate dehydrogenase [Helicobacter bilis]MCI7410202.1 type I glyceraldehyde-3-phosphate dehydrogenase [Helicobacter bilis]MDD7297649.1 type I glyceraldehyde-3-phosphate dehydrogenase [Helicobacter bilis]MDY4400790.1 type I glyceraldehyde-3-phosphate dehydrogenase [Helicobacter bilis]TLE09507.1 type I glyceraldehyde-3-phosphate dehydrogenase [Helicobacter bilis]
MAIKLAINGTGRIGLCAARIIGERDDVELVSINTTASIDTLVHLLRYDSVHRFYDVEKLDENTLRIGKSKNVKILSDRDPLNLDFGEAVAVLECTGKFNALDKAKAHIKGNVKRVIISAPADNTPTFVYGVNHTQYNNESVISNASCTTNCLAPIVKVLDSTFGIENALMSTIHSYTNDQNLLDVKHKDLRRARAAALSMIPTSTGAAKAIGLVLPHLAGKLNGIAVRVPTPDVSLVDLSVNLKSEASKDSINEAFYKAQSGESFEGTFKGLVIVDDEMRVSSDFIGSKASAVIVPDKTIAIGKSVKVLAWYDNEMGYTHRLVDMSAYVCKGL